MASDGDDLKREGIDRVVENAGEIWGNCYESLFDGFLSANVGQEITGEMFHLYVRDNCGDPHHPNALGGKWLGVMNRALKDGRLGAPDGLSRASKKESHSSTNPRYFVNY